MARRKISPHIVTNFHKLICVDLCRFVDRVFLTGVPWRIGDGRVLL